MKGLVDTLFKIDLEQRLAQGNVVLELGCGASKTDGRIGVDILDLPGVDIVTNLDNGLPFLPDNSVDSIHTYHFLEHVNDLDALLRELHRVTKPDGTIVIRVPHFSNPHYYSDPTHKQFFGLYTFEYYAAKQTRFKRKVPGFYNDYSFETKSIKLVFYSPWLFRKIPRKIAQLLFNANPWWQEFYEENVVNFMPATELVIVLSPSKSVK